MPGLTGGALQMTAGSNPKPVGEARVYKADKRRGGVPLERRREHGWENPESTIDVSWTQSSFVVDWWTTAEHQAVEA